MTTPKHTNLHAGSLLPLQVGVDAPLSAGDAPSGEHSLACSSDMRDALADLTQDNRLSILRIEDRKCPMGVCLEKHGLARWATHAGPGKWVITQKGWLFLETRNRQARETR